MTRGAELLATWGYASGRTWADIAGEIGVAPVTLYKWLSGDRTPSMRHAYAIREITGGKVPMEAWVQPAEENPEKDDGNT